MRLFLANLAASTTPGRKTHDRHLPSKANNTKANNTLRSPAAQLLVLQTAHRHTMPLCTLGCTGYISHAHRLPHTLPVCTATGWPPATHCCRHMLQACLVTTGTRPTRQHPDTKPCQPGYDACCLPYTSKEASTLTLNPNKRPCIGPHHPQH